MRYHLVLIALLTNNVIVITRGYKTNSTFENFVKMVRGNLSKAAAYELPVNNEKLCYVKPTEKNKIYAYGTFDFIIIGAGSAGTLLANRLTEIGEWKVLLLEAGGEENDFSDIPGMNFELYSSDMNWGYLTTPQKKGCQAMEEHRCNCARGKVVGGSSTVNSKMYVRGNKADYDEWEEMGNPGWSYKDVLPYFIKTENSHIHDRNPGYHGKGGLLDVGYFEPTIFTTMFLNAKKELGDKVLDYNGKNQIGVSPIQSTIKGNKIASGGRAFIDPILKRKNLNVTINAFVTKLRIDTKQKIAKGVEFIKGGRTFKARAEKEVILSAGAINTPQILMLSGIGPKEELDRIGVETLVDLPVGKGLEDHATFFGLNVRTNQTLFRDSLEVLLENYLNNRRPYTAAFNADSVSFLNVNDKKSSVPDIEQILFTPPGFGPNLWKSVNLRKEFKGQLEELQVPYNDVFVLIVLLHPKSKGSVTLKSKNPLDFPNIDYNYYAVEEDMDTMLKGINEGLKLFETDAFRAVNAQLAPIVRICTGYIEGTEDFWRCAVEQATTTLYHPVGTTKMGKSRNNSVVSSKLRVHGMKGLRIVDAGVIPKIPSGHMNAPTFMIAERAADFIKHYWN
ncbi:glucose dehydrogenase [FAD, quinone]-like [Anoplophora glabripennis]|uniref:glucose dehydrogenase [FAD, quinone]-like n=1 Tax=Anoplophora glabripennis TaxID=217634 RepID=UPI000873E6FD|nr:glucose dehydrogenase [FAD, quinone]-like [Anoplophora glabripennis]